MGNIRVSLTSVVLAATVVGAPAPAHAEEAKKKSSDAAEFAYVATSGNSESSTFGFKNTYTWADGPSSLEIKAGGVRAESTTTNRVAAGPDAGSYTVIEDSVTALTAESYFLNGRYDRKFSPRSFWYGGTGWDRNRFAGVDNRYTVVAGLGSVWIDTDRRTFKTDYAATYTNEENVVEDPAFNSNFAGLRVTLNFLQKFGAAGVFTHATVLDQNLDDGSDVRINMTNSVAMSMTRRLALKVSLQWLYDNQPALQELALENPIGTPTGQTVLEPLDDLDTVFTTSLVINF